MGSDRELQDYDTVTVSTDDDDLDRSDLLERRDTVASSMTSRCVALQGRLMLM